MRPADEIHIVRPGLAVWQAYDPAVRTDLTASAFDTPAGLVLCDPIALTRSAMEELLAINPSQKIAAILLTSANHQRVSAIFAKRFNVPIHASTAAKREIEASRWFEENTPLEILPAQLAGSSAPPSHHSAFIIHHYSLPGFAPGETAYFFNGALILGDALINLPPYGFAILPDKYCSDPKLAHSSLKRLLPLPVETLVFAHGLPIVGNAAGRLAALIG